MTGQEYRVERDSMGEVKVPKSAYYGAQTQRAVENFPISGIGFPPRFVRALAIIKHAAVSVNQELGLLDSKIADVIRAAASEVMDGKLDKLDKEFVVDIFQTGSGRSAARTSPTRLRFAWAKNLAAILVRSSSASSVSGLLPAVWRSLLWAARQ